MRRALPASGASPCSGAARLPLPRPSRSGSTHRWPTFALLAALLGGCATAGERSGAAYTPPPLPTAAEVADHVAAHWNEEYRLLFARDAGRPGDPATLLKVDQVACEYLYVTPQCRFAVTGRLSSGAISTQQGFAQFEREPDGRLRSVIVLYEERRR